VNTDPSPPLADVLQQTPPMSGHSPAPNPLPIGHDSHSNLFSVNILIVDDEPKNLTVLESLLDDSRYRLFRAESADEALLALVTEEFALLILDIRMPGMTGLELAKIIKDRKKTSRIPIIFLTAYYNDDLHVLDGYGSGAVDYLHKPVNSVILRSKVAVFAEMHLRTRESELANRALIAEIAERRRVEHELRELNNTLELRVAERTVALRKSEEVLKDADQRKDEFLATLAHELRNPLAPVRNSLELMKRANGNTALIDQVRSTMERQISHMVRLIDDLLDVSRITRNRLELKLEQVELANVLHDAVEACRPHCERAGHALTIVLPPEPIYLRADPTRLVQIFGNLLTNACKYTKPGGHIWLTAARQGNEVIVSVKDTGIGIPPVMLPKVFDLFTQIDNSLERSAGGLGIGLSLAKRLTEMHEGNVTAHSEGQDQGSEFIVRLPISSGVSSSEASSAVAMSAPPQPAADKSRSAGARRILVVDDTRDSADSLAMLLKITGHETQTAHNGLEAIEKAESYRPNVILLDIGMPKMNGYDACRAIRGQPWGQDIKMIALTGWGQEEDRRKSKDAGFDGHLVKPVDISALLALLADAQPTRIFG
jgi:signal transduction histidine kinase